MPSLSLYLIDGADERTKIFEASDDGSDDRLRRRRRLRNGLGWNGLERRRRGTRSSGGIAHGAVQIVLSHVIMTKVNGSRHDILSRAQYKAFNTYFI